MPLIGDPLFEIQQADPSPGVIAARVAELERRLIELEHPWYRRVWAAWRKTLEGVDRWLFNWRP